MSERLPPHAQRRLLDAAASAADDTDDVEGLAESERAAVPERYRIVREIGRGGMGVVYEAQDTELDRRVALKLLTRGAAPNESARLRFVREARAAARLSHPHIATVYDATPDSIAMQLVDGETLADVHPSRRELAAITRDAALAIHFAHGEGIVHRDLKPANLMVEQRDSGDAKERYHVYVTDFGLAAEREVDTRLSASGGIVGTPAYMAPEQASGEREAIGPATDVYGLGATLFHCLAGRPPFAEENLYTTLEQVVNQPAPSLVSVVPSIDRDLSLMVAKCLEKDPARRYPSALALAGDLDRWLSGEAIQARPPSVGYRLRLFASRRQGLLVTALVAAGLVSLVGGPLLWQARRAREHTRRVFELNNDVMLAMNAARGSKRVGLGLESRAFDVLQEAVQDCRDFLEQSEDPHVLLLLGRLEREGEHLEAALAALQRASELDASIPGLDRERGMVLAALFRNRLPLFKGEEWTDELKAYRVQGAAALARSIDLDVEALTVEESYARAMWYWLEDDTAMALQELKAVTEMDRSYAEAHRSLAMIYTMQGETDLALHHGSIASELFGGNRVAYVPRSGARTSEGDVVLLEYELLALDGLDELVIDFDLRMQTVPNTANNHGFRGQSELRRALRSLQRGSLLEAHQSLLQAIDEFTSAAELDPGSAAPLLNRGVCHALADRLLSDTGQDAGAAQARLAAGRDYDTAIRLQPDLAVAFFDRALFARRMATFARLSFSREGMEAHRERARSDAVRALALASGSARRARMLRLAEELGES